MPKPCFVGHGSQTVLNISKKKKKNLQNWCIKWVSTTGIKNYGFLRLWPFSECFCFIFTVFFFCEYWTKLFHVTKSRFMSLDLMTCAMCLLNALCLLGLCLWFCICCAVVVVVECFCVCFMLLPPNKVLCQLWALNLINGNFNV